MDKIFAIATQNRQRIIDTFKVFYLVLVTVLFFGGWQIFKGGESAAFWYRLAPTMGQAGLVAYILTTIPGTARRFRIQHKLLAILMMYRRYVGISMYLLVSVHYFFNYGIASLVTRIAGIIPEFFFMQMGLIAYVLTFFMFVTSNDFSTRRLGAWWGKIHRLTYIIIWFIVLHVALQRISVWSVAIIATALLQGASFLYAAKQKLSRDRGYRDR